MKNQINDGGPAIPMAWNGQRSHEGVSIRDYFAAAALPVAWNAYDSGYFGDTGHESANHAVATAAYQMADAMLKVRDSQ